MNQEWKDRSMRMARSVVTAFAFTCFAAIAGELNPPGVPGPTMHSLEQVYQQAVSNYDKPELVAISNMLWHTIYIDDPYMTNSFGAMAAKVDMIATVQTNMADWTYMNDARQSNELAALNMKMDAIHMEQSNLTYWLRPELCFLTNSAALTDVRLAGLELRINAVSNMISAQNVILAENNALLKEIKTILVGP